MQYEEVRSPREGIAFDVRAVEKGVLSGGNVIMKIIPQKKLKGSVTVGNKDIGYIKVGQKAQVRVDSFDYTRFGYIDANIKSIGAELKPDPEKEGTYLFPVVLELQRNYLETKGVKIPLMSGMSITANLKLREKRLISVVSDLFNDNYDSLLTSNNRREENGTSGLIWHEWFNDDENEGLSRARTNVGVL